MNESMLCHDCGFEFRWEEALDECPACGSADVAPIIFPSDEVPT